MNSRIWLFDAGNTLVFLDHDVVADLASVPSSAVRRAEGVAKRRYETKLREGSGHASGWDVFMTTLLEEAGAADPPSALHALKAEHARFNLWRRVPEGLLDALDRAAEAGVRMGVVSNSEGQLKRLFARVGLAGRFEVVIDSAIVGISKPDPRIFAVALEAMQVSHPSEATYVGDIPSVDIDGARAAGLRAILVDELDFYPEQPDRRRSIVALVQAIAAGRV